MASAGRILIMPKGNYDSTLTYEMLDLVKHNGTSWLAKKTSVGIEPSKANSEYWQDVFDANSIEESITRLEENLNKRIDGSLSFKLNANNKLELYVNDMLFGTIAFIE